MKLMVMAAEAVSAVGAVCPNGRLSRKQAAGVASAPENSNYTAARLEVNARACGAGV